MLIAVGLAVGYRANVWNIGAEGQLALGAICGGGVALAFHGTTAAARAAGDDRRRRARRHGVGGDSGAAAHALQRQRDPDVADARLRRDTCCCRGWCTGRGAIRKASISRSRSMFAEDALLPNAARRHAAQRRACSLALAVVAAGVGVHAQQPRRLPDARRGARAGARRATPAFRRGARCGSACWSAARARASPASARSPGRSASCCRRCRPATASPRSSSRSSGACIRSGILLASLLMSLLYLGGEAAQIGLGAAVGGDRAVPGHAAVLPARRRRVHQLSACASCAARRADCGRADGRRIVHLARR